MDCELDKRIEFAERRVLACQTRVFEQKEKASSILKRLEREYKGLEDVKKEWIRKQNLEDERIKVELNELKKAHRHAIEDLRLKYEEERKDKLRDLKVLIADEEKELNEWKRRRDEESRKTKREEDQIQSVFNEKMNAFLKAQQSTSRRGVVRQKRLLDAPNVFSMTLEKNKPTGMKKRSLPHRRNI